MKENIKSNDHGASSSVYSSVANKQLKRNDDHIQIQSSIDYRRIPARIIIMWRYYTKGRDFFFHIYSLYINSLITLSFIFIIESFSFYLGWTGFMQQDDIIYKL